MQIAQQAYQDGQEYRKANGMQVADEVIANRAMEAFTHTSLDFQHWHLYNGNWIAGFQFVEDVPQEHEYSQQKMPRTRWYPLARVYVTHSTIRGLAALWRSAILLLSCSMGSG
jgi:hypothetical protein